MKSFEEVYKQLEDLFINKLPEYIEKTNKHYNDGLIMQPFVNTTLKKECIKRPCFKFRLEETEYTEKDRIIENTIFTISIELKLLPDTDNEIIFLSRYGETIQKMIEELESENLYEIIKISNNKIFIRITLCG